MLKKVYIFFLLIMFQRMLIGSEAPDFLKAFYTQIDPTKIHVGLREGISYCQKHYLEIVLYNSNAQNTDIKNEHFVNMMNYFNNLENKSSFTLVKNDSSYNICINKYVVAQIDQQNLKNISTITFGYLIEGEQMQNYRTLHFPSLQEEINSLHLLFAETSNFTCKGDVIQLIKSSREGRDKGFASNGLTNLSEGYDKFVRKVIKTNYNLLSKHLVEEEINNDNSQKEDAKNKVKATNTCDKIEPKTDYRIYIARSLSIIMIIVLAKLLVIDKIFYTY